MTYLPDVNVLVALAVDGHPRHSQAKHWFDGLNEDRLLLCRITEMGLLRLLTNSVVMAGAPLKCGAAWKVVDTFLEDPRGGLLKEPVGFEEHWRRNSRAGVVGPNFWTDSYLASLSASAGCTLVTFDRALSSRKGVAALLLGTKPH